MLTGFFVTLGNQRRSRYRLLPPVTLGGLKKEAMGIRLMWPTNGTHFEIPDTGKETP